MKIIHRDDHPDKKVYSITEKEREKFLYWMKELRPMEKARSAQLIQFYFSYKISDTQDIKLFE